MYNIVYSINPDYSVTRLSFSTLSGDAPETQSHGFYRTTNIYICGKACSWRDMLFKRKIRTHLDLLSIPQSGGKMSKRLGGIIGFFFLFFFHLTYSRWTSSLPSCLWSQRIFPSLPGSRLTIFYRDASSALLQLVNQWLSFTYSRSHAFRYERKNTNPTLVRIELTTSVLAYVQLTY